LAHASYPSPKVPGGGVPSKIPDTPLPPVLFFWLTYPHPPFRKREEELPPLFLIPKGVFRMEHKVKEGGRDHPFGRDQGAG